LSVVSTPSADALAPLTSPCPVSCLFAYFSVSPYHSYTSRLDVSILHHSMAPYFCPTLIVCSSFTSPFDNTLLVTSTFDTVSILHTYALAHNSLFSLFSLQSRTTDHYHLLRQHVVMQSQTGILRRRGGGHQPWEILRGLEGGLIPGPVETHDHGHCTYGFRRS